MQRAAVAAINANAPHGAQGALIALDRDGAVRAMVGGRDYVNSSYNRATQATRQPGSSFKLFVYLTAIEAGYQPNTAVQDAPITIGGWSPRNGNGRYAGPVSVRQAFALSINTVAVRLAQEVGTRAVADMAQRFGITTRVDTNPSMALGSSAVRVIDMTRAYAAVARGGVSVTPYGIRRVTTTDGTLLYQHQDPEQRVLVAPWVAAQMTDLLQSVVANGTGRSAGLGRPTAGKTGTTSSNKDAWFIGFSSGITTAVWMGRDDNRALPGLAGGRAPARAFHDFMMRAVANRPVEQFATEVADARLADGGRQRNLVRAARRRALRRCRRQPGRARRPRRRREAAGRTPRRATRRTFSSSGSSASWTNGRSTGPGRRAVRRRRATRRHLSSLAERRGGAERAPSRLSHVRAGLGIRAEQAARRARGNRGRD